MYRIRFRAQGSDEFAAAGDWYEGERRGLREAFLDAVDSQLGRIAANPLLYPDVHRGIRKAALKRFP